MGKVFFNHFSQGVADSLEFKISDDVVFVRWETALKWFGVSEFAVVANASSRRVVGL